MQTAGQHFGHAPAVKAGQTIGEDQRPRDLAAPAAKMARWREGALRLARRCRHRVARRQACQRSGKCR